MGTYSWLCAKSKISIPDDAAASVYGGRPHLMEGPLKANAINLHLVGGTVISGLYQGYGEMSVIVVKQKTAYDIDLGVDPILSRCGSWRPTIEAVLEATGSEPKLVRQDQASPDDRYDNLPVSEPCPMGGHFYSTQEIIDVIYGGDANLAWKVEAATQYDPADVETEFEATKAELWTFLTQDVPDHLLHGLNEGDVEINDILDAMSNIDNPEALP